VTGRMLRRAVARNLPLISAALLFAVLLAALAQVVSALDTGPRCCPTATWLELGWTALALMGDGLSLWRAYQAVLTLRDAAGTRHVPALERIYARINVRRGVIRAAIFTIAAAIGALAAATPPGRAVTGQVGAAGLLLIVLLLLADSILDEIDGHRITMAVRDEQLISRAHVVLDVLDVPPARGGEAAEREGG
jgi:hypothetical protein